MQQRRSSQASSARSWSAAEPDLPARLQGGGRRRQAARQPLRRAGALRSSSWCCPTASDVQMILAEAGVDAGRLAADMTRAIDRLPYGATSIEEFSDHIFHAIQEAWSFGSLQLRRRGGALRLHPARRLKVPVLDGAARQDQRASSTRSTPTPSPARLDDVLDGSIEGRHRRRAAEPSRRRRGGRRAATPRWRSTPPTSPQRARDGKIDPVVGRDPEIRQIIDMLMRRRQNNPILTGEAGVGKTAVVEGFALRLAEGDVPPMLKDVSLRMLDVGLMQAGASVKGEFEKRLKCGDRRGPVLRGADHPLHRRGAHPDRRRRRGRHRRRREPPEAGAGARRAPHHRRDHLGRIQAAHREGPGADPPLPGRQGRRAGRGDGGADAARRRRACSRSTTRCRSSTRRSRPRSTCRTATSRRGSSPTRR